MCAITKPARNWYGNNQTHDISLFFNTCGVWRDKLVLARHAPSAHLIAVFSHVVKGFVMVHHPVFAQDKLPHCSNKVCN